MLTASAEAGLIDQQEYFQKRVASQDLSHYYLLERGDFAYNHSSSGNAALGIIKRLDAYDFGCLSTLYIVFHPERDIDSDYLLHYFESSAWHGDVAGMVTEGARNHGLLNISPDTFFTARCSFPSLPEQHRIGEFFSTLDSLIAAAERQDALLKRKKQAYLQFMFPRENENEPRLRFSGFSSDWEQRQLGDVCARRSTQAVSSACLPSVEYDDVVAGGGVFVSDFVPKLGKRGIRFESGDVLFGKLRPYLGNRLHPDFNGVAVGDWWVLAPLHADSSFLFSIVQSPKFCIVANQSSGSKMPRADWKLVNSEVFGIPSLPEQRLIGRFFSTLDSLIAAAEERTRALKEMKSAYLQRMFV